jgi:hypothetical protein
MGHYLSEMESPEPIYKLKDVCHKCATWTLDKKHGKYKCHCGDCPALERDHRNKPPVIPSRKERLLKEISRLEKAIEKLKKQL